MKKKVTHILAAAFAFALCFPNAHAADRKLAQTGFQFLSIPTQARPAAMGEAFTTMAGQSTSIFYNPANMARVSSFLDVSLSRNQWIANIDHYAASLSVRPKDGEYGVVGFSVLSVDYGDFLGTRVDPATDKGYEDTGTFSPTAYAMGIAYAKSLTDRFSVGAHVKYVSQTLGNSVLPVSEVGEGETLTVENTVGVMAFDFGTYYNTGFKSLAFGMTVRNFSKEIQYELEGFQLPLTFYIGISMNILDLFMEESQNHSLLVSVDATHPRAFSERLNLGAEYVFMNLFSLRGGYQHNYDVQDITTGFGIHKSFGRQGSVSIDYAYTPFQCV